jgi:hypothetical protein
MVDKKKFPLRFWCCCGIRDSGSWMDKNQDPGSGMNIPDPQHWCSYLCTVTYECTMYLWDPLGSIILSGFISRKLFFTNPDPSLSNSTVVSFEPLLNFI